MVFNVGASLLDTVVLSAVEKEGTYGYKITQQVRRVMDISESTLYPVLRRLLKNNCLEAYDMQIGGRNRRYYKITDTGRKMLKSHLMDWSEFTSKMDDFFLGGGLDE